MWFPIIIVLFAISLLCQFIVGFYYQKLLKEAKNMSGTVNPLLKQCKTRFSGNFQLHHGMPNVSVFVDRFLSGLCLGKIPIRVIGHLSSQFMLAGIFVTGLGACESIALGKNFSEILPFYILAMAMLYSYFSVSGIVNRRGKENRLKIYLTDYLENNMSIRIPEAEREKKRLSEFEMKAEEHRVNRRSQNMEQTEKENTAQAEELEMLLEEYFAVN